MSIAEAFAPAEQAYRNNILLDMWGHCLPEARVKHNGSVIFTHGTYGDLTVIRHSFEIESSPWFYQAIHNFISEKKTIAGSLYRFVGTCMLCKNGRFIFSGKTDTIL